MSSGPFCDDLRVGQVFRPMSSTCLTPALAVTHQSIVGSWLPLAHPGPAQRAGLSPPLASPSLVWDVSIGHSTPATREVVANLFYRGLAFHRMARLGDELATTTHVVALRGNRPREGRRPTGMALLRITTLDQQERPVLDFLRCAMLPAGKVIAEQGDWDAGPLPAPPLDQLCDWRRPESGEPSAARAPRTVHGDADVVSSAPELARLTLNVARVHHDHRMHGRRLVYGGHTIGLAFSQACRAIDGIVTPVAWDSCSHVAPVLEGDTLISAHDLVDRGAGPAGTRLLEVHTTAQAVRDDGVHLVLDWRWRALQG